jgi:hypothetical protein
VDEEKREKKKNHFTVPEDPSVFSKGELKVLANDLYRVFVFNRAMWEEKTEEAA